MTTENVVCIRKNGHTFLFLFDDAGFAGALRQAGMWASDPELPDFGWHDAAVMSEQARRLCPMVNHNQGRR